MSVSIAVSRTEKNYVGGVAKAMKVRAEGGGRAVLARAMMRAGEPQPASSQRRLAEWRAQHQPRFTIGDGKGLYLHLDGQGVTTERKRAWFGTEDQLVRALACFSSAKGMHGIRVLKAQAPVRSLHMEAWGAR